MYDKCTCCLSVFLQNITSFSLRMHCFIVNFIIPKGHSGETTDGHAQFMQGVQPVIGYNGKFGYRRNTPWLRKDPSPFGTGSRSATH